VSEQAYRPRLIIFQGPSASGKNTLQARLGARRVVTWTSRPARPGEQHGVDYVFSTREEMAEKEQQGLFLELTTYNGERYGSSLETIRQVLDSGHFASIVLDAPGAAKLKAFAPNQVLLVGVYAGREDCRRRLAERGFGAAEQAARLASYEQEFAALRQCDLTVNNSDGYSRTAAAILAALRGAAERE
jgi:guanylate kinase